MMLADGNIANVVLRAVVLLGAILAAGSALCVLTLPVVTNAARKILRRQIWLGTFLVLVCEPIRWFAGQIAMAGGDVSLALDPSMRWIAFEMPQGQAALLRLLGVLLITASGLRWKAILLAGLAITVASFAFEGHTAAASNGASWISLFLVVHIASVSWWFAGLWPLAVAARVLEHNDAAQAVSRFGQIAVFAFGLIAATGVLMFLTLTGGTIDLSRSYQQILLAKLGVVGAILALAAFNRIVLTPRMVTSAQAAKRHLNASIGFEAALACLVLLLTGALSATSPGLSH